jgi:type I restriction enzyme M protein
MIHEQAQPPWRRPSPIPADYDWAALIEKDGDALEAQYRHTLESLGKQRGMLGLLFRKAQNKT